VNSSDLTAAFRLHFGDDPESVFLAPGRINLLGGHTDYNHGLALPAAIDRHIGVVVRPRADRRVRVFAADIGAEWTLSLDAGAQPTADWQRYLAGGIAVFPASLPHGLDVLIAGDIPRGSGLSSSAALLVAWMLALRAATGAVLSDLEICQLCQRVEHEHLGVKCGLLDPIGSLCPSPGAVLRVDFADLTMQSVPAPMTGLSWVVLHTGVHRSLASSGYGDRVTECAQGLARIQRLHPASVRTVRDLTAEMLIGDDIPMRRLRHVLAENERVELATRALQAGRPAELGPLLLSAHASLRDDYAVSCPELDAMVDLAARHPACLGGRMMGGGFGGCTVNLVHSDGAEALMASVLSDYHQRFPHTGRAFAVRLVGGARAHAV
jgi:galactokinase